MTEPRTPSGKVFIRTETDGRIFVQAESGMLRICRDSFYEGEWRTDPEAGICIGLEYLGALVNALEDIQGGT